MRTQKEMEELRKELFKEWDKANSKEEMLCFLSLENSKYELIEIGGLPNDWKEEDIDYFINTFLKEDISKALKERGRRLEN